MRKHNTHQPWRIIAKFGAVLCGAEVNLRAGTRTSWGEIIFWEEATVASRLITPSNRLQR